MGDSLLFWLICAIVVFVVLASFYAACRRSSNAMRSRILVFASCVAAAIVLVLAVAILIGEI